MSGDIYVGLFWAESSKNMTWLDLIFLNTGRKCGNGRDCIKFASVQIGANLEKNFQINFHQYNFFWEREKGYRINLAQITFHFYKRTSGYFRP